MTAYDDVAALGASALDARAAVHGELQGVGLASCAGDCAEPGACGTASPAESRDARQGHRYSHHGIDVIALESGPFVKVIYIDPTQTFCSPPYFAKAEDLIPQPMAYYHGEVPA